MSLDISFIGILIGSIMASSVPLILAASGELITERSGVLNLGVEGMMIIGAISGFALMVITDNLFIAIVGGGQICPPPTIAIKRLSVITIKAKPDIAPIIIIPSTPKFKTPDLSVINSPDAASINGTDEAIIDPIRIPIKLMSKLIFF